MSEYEWEYKIARLAKARCKYCGRFFIVPYAYDSDTDYLHIPKYFWCLCDKCKKKIISDIPKRYKVKGVWRDFQTYAKDYKIERYKFCESDVTFEGAMQMSKEFLGEQFTNGGIVDDCRCTSKKGVYIIVYNGVSKPEFSPASPMRDKIKNGKTKPATVSLERLNKEWVDNANVLYIGKAGNLQARMDEHVEGWNGRIESYHVWGGRLIAQVKDFGKLGVWYLEKEIESELISRFEKEYGKLPFANLRR